MEGSTERGYQGQTALVWVKGTMPQVRHVCHRPTVQSNLKGVGLHSALYLFVERSTYCVFH